MFWMLKAGNPNAIHLYEPLHDKLFRLIYEEGSVMHGEVCGTAIKMLARK